MRFALTLLTLSGLFGLASSAEPPAQKQDVLKQLEGEWVLKAAVVATPNRVGAANLNAPNTPKMELRITAGTMEMISDGKPVPGGGGRIELGSEPQCLLWHGLPGQQPYKNRFKLEGDTLTIVQDMAFRGDCPESFDAEKGRYRERRVLTFSRARSKR